MYLVLDYDDDDDWVLAVVMYKIAMSNIFCEIDVLWVWGVIGSTLAAEREFLEFCGVFETFSTTRI